MIQNYLKIALRNLLRQKGYSFINIAGLAVGMACCILIFLWVQDEVSYDRFHENIGSLYRVYRTSVSEGKVRRTAITTAMAGPALVEEFPEIIYATRFDDKGKRLVIAGEERFKDEIALADGDFFSMFSFPIILGDPQTALVDPSSVVITERASQKYFGAENPIGQTLDIDRREYTVSAVLADIPDNSHLKFDCLLSFESRSQYLKDITNNWKVSAYYNYVQLREGANAADVNAKIADLVSRHLNGEGKEVTLHLQPIRRVHLYHDVKDYMEGHGDIKYVYLFSVLGLITLLVACINFINLTTARSADRAREVGLRKVVGAKKTGLIWQFLGESVVLVAMALVIALVIVESVLPTINQLSGKTLDVDLGSSVALLPGLLGILLVTGLLAGLYPAFVITAFTPVKVLKGQYREGKSGAKFRSVLVVVQFSVAIFLMISAFIVFDQLNFMREKDLGYEEEQLVYLSMRGGFAENYEAIKTELLRHPSILGITAGVAPTEGMNPAQEMRWDGGQADDEEYWSVVPLDFGYIEVLGMEIIEGRSFSRDISSDATSGFVLNEAAARRIDPESVAGRAFGFKSFGEGIDLVERQGNIIGVVKDFHFASMHQEIAPVILYYDPTKFYEMIIRVDGQKIPEALGLLREKWDLYASEYLFEYQFADEYLDNLYRTEQRLGKTFGLFTVLAICISCLGLLGLASFTAQRRTKEIGIRKVLGATVSGLITLMTREFAVLVFISVLIAGPAAWYVMHRWLQNFAYRIEISPWLFLGVGLAALCIAATTAGFQTVKAALANPVKALRYE